MPADLPALDQVLIRVDLDRPDFQERDIRRLPSATWKSVLDSGLVRETQAAETAECDCSWDLHDEDVYHAPAESSRAGRPYISCPEVGIVWLEPERLRRWTVDVPRLVERVAAALSCSGRIEEIVPSRLWLLGRTTVHGRSREVFFARQLIWPRNDAKAVSGCARFRAAVAPLLLVPQIVPQPHAWHGGPPRILTLTSVLSLRGDQLVADLAYVESACVEDAVIPPAPTRSPAPRFGTPDGATWSDVELRFHDVHTVSVRVGEARGVFHYAQMGMADGRSTLPTEQWKLLYTFANAPGNVLDWTSREARRKNKKRCEKLVANLTRFFQIQDGTPIAYSKRDHGWRAIVRLSA